MPGGSVRSRVIISDQEVGRDLLKFCRMLGINFKNITSMDEAIVEKISQCVQEGWVLDEVTASVKSPAGMDDCSKTGIFITSYFFRKEL